MRDPSELASELSKRGLEWADAEAAASSLEEAKKSLVAELSLQYPGESKASAEMKALADPAYKLHVTQMIAARKEANRALVRYRVYQVFVDLERTQESTKRAELKAFGA